MELNPGKTSVGLQSMCSAIQIMGERLTHLYLAHNRLSGIPQITTALSVSLYLFVISIGKYVINDKWLQTYCPNLLLLDLSNVTTVAASHGILPLEKIQMGCTKLKVLRITNSHISLSTVTLQEQVWSSHFIRLNLHSVLYGFTLCEHIRLNHPAFLIWKSCRSPHWPPSLVSSTMNIYSASSKPARNYNCWTFVEVLVSPTRVSSVCQPGI